LITYSRAAAIRASLRRAGLNINSIIPKDTASKDWSHGTLGIKKSNEKRPGNEKRTWSLLSEMEEDHLRSVASIPYRDPSGESSGQEIISRRTIEQSKSNLKSTSLWKRQWVHTKDY